MEASVVIIMSICNIYLAIHYICTQRMNNCMNAESAFDSITPHSQPSNCKPNYQLLSSRPNNSSNATQ